MLLLFCAVGIGRWPPPRGSQLLFAVTHLSQHRKHSTSKLFLRSATDTGACFCRKWARVVTSTSKWNIVDFFDISAFWSSKKTCCKTSPCWCLKMTFAKSLMDNFNMVRLNVVEFSIVPPPAAVYAMHVCSCAVLPHTPYTHLVRRRRKVLCLRRQRQKLLLAASVGVTTAHAGPKAKCLR